MTTSYLSAPSDGSKTKQDLPLRHSRAFMNDKAGAKNQPMIIDVMTGNFVCDGERPTKAWETSAASEGWPRVGVAVLLREGGEKSPPEVDDHRLACPAVIGDGTSGRILTKSKRRVEWRDGCRKCEGRMRG